MVSSLHEAMHSIFGEDPGLFARVTRTLDIPPFETPISATPLPTDLTENQPVERRVDTLLRIEAPSGDYILAVEAQNQPDPRKPNSWAYYLAHLQAKYHLPPVLLVVCPDQRTADWAAQEVKIGPPQWSSLRLTPLVLGPGNVPVARTPEEAASDVPLAVLSAVLHRTDRDVDVILEALVAALKVLDRETAEKLIDLTGQGLDDNTKAIAIWRNLVAADTSFFKSSLSQEIRAEGEVHRATANILLLLDRRGIPVSDTDRAHITACDDLDTLTLWFERAITATSIAEVFAEDPANPGSSPKQ
ncbi:hypothetical protein [Streptomyces ureilyticus]|uniref:Transposase (putative) YhgA-like domain-containing protein n=1 Tax=Streptomyces ureilyticus TaxID=1775131 RepID=A0ABX0DH95_9ACTN|nr:hypothetical protein [Streptomyces ureilyticus]NGO41241.1 hypothetical protein [Streptomyces ureilyticus]